MQKSKKWVRGKHFLMTLKLLAFLKPMENKEHDLCLGSIRQTHHNGKKDDRNYGNGVKIKQCTVAKAFRVSWA